VTVSLSLAELAAVVAVSVGLAATDAAAVSRLAVAYVAKKAGLKPAEIRGFDAATDGDEEGDGGA